MARTETTARHTHDSLMHLATELEDCANRVKAAAVMLIAEPVIESVDVKYESSRLVGFEKVQSWASAAREAAFEARLNAAKKSVSAKPDTKKTRGRIAENSK